LLDNKKGGHEMVLNKKVVYGIIIIVVVGFAAVWFGFKFVFGLYNPFYVVASGSMIPNLNVGDLVIVRNNTISSSINDNNNNNNNPYSFNNLKVGDIIIFKSPGTDNNGEHLTIVHRIAKIAIDKRDGGSRVIRTKGDANPSSIPFLDYPLREVNYIGKVVYVIPKVGLITQLIRPPINYIIIGFTVIGMVYYLRKATKG
jgi:signal peptidase